MLKINPRVPLATIQDTVKKEFDINIGFPIWRREYINYPTHKLVLGTFAIQPGFFVFTADVIYKDTEYALDNLSLFYAWDRSELCKDFQLEWTLTQLQYEKGN